MLFSRRHEISITPLGGINGVGHNCFLYMSGESAVVVDCGIKPRTYEFRKQTEEPDDFWVANPTLIGPPPRLDILDGIRSRKSVIGIMTHAHLDHIGAVAELSRRGIPVHLSWWSKRFIECYTGNLKIPMDTEFHICNGKVIQHGDLHLSPVPVQHSIPGTNAVLLGLNGKKNILHLGDFKFNGLNDRIDETGRILQDIRRRAGKIHCLVLDVLNIEVDGFTPPEQRVFDSLEKIIAGAAGRVIILFFSSNLCRMKKIIEIGQSQNRTVGVSGLSMSSSCKMLGNLSQPQNGDILLMAGGQGEENSGIAKMARNEHRFLELRPSDTIVFAARSIPGNEEGVRGLLDNLRRRGARIILHEGESKKLNLDYEVEEAFVHVSGHGQNADIVRAIELLEPTIIIPFHASEDRYRLFEKMLGNRWKIERLAEGKTLNI